NTRLNARHLSDCQQRRGGIGYFCLFEPRHHGFFIQMVKFINQCAVNACLSGRIITNNAGFSYGQVAGDKNNERARQLHIPSFAHNSRTGQQQQKVTQPLNAAVKRGAEKLDVPGHINAKSYIPGNTTLTGHKYYSLSESLRLLSSVRHWLHYPEIFPCAITTRITGRMILFSLMVVIWRSHQQAKAGERIKHTMTSAGLAKPGIFNRRCLV
ncbi:hypothetical protein, partial [Escherichia coli]|uniref:hypothetical protein n=1 Tax=Escherichia coli TaxID=562 RepID=UPI0015C452C6